MRVGAGSSKSAGAIDERMAAGVGVGIDENELTGCFGKRFEDCVGFGVGVAEDGYGMPCSENARRGEFEAEALFELDAREEF